MRGGKRPPLLLSLQIFTQTAEVEATREDLLQQVSAYLVTAGSQAHWGREVVQDLNVKLDVMKLLQDSSPEVQKEALLCTQKIMLGKDTLSFVGA